MFLLVRVCSEFSQQRRNAEAHSTYNTAQLLSMIGLIAEGAIASFVMLKKLSCYHCSDTGVCLQLSHPVISNESQLIELALECIYVCESCDQLSNAFAILECLPQVRAKRCHHACTFAWYQLLSVHAGA